MEVKIKLPEKACKMALIMVIILLLSTCYFILWRSIKNGRPESSMDLLTFLSPRRRSEQPAYSSQPRATQEDQEVSAVILCVNETYLAFAKEGWQEDFHAIEVQLRCLELVKKRSADLKMNGVRSPS